MATPYGAGWTYAGGTVLGSAASSAVVPIGTWDMLYLQYMVTGYGGGGDIVSLRFNGDSGNNYWDRHLTSGPGGTILANVQTLSTNLIRLAALSANVQRSGHVAITNNRTTSKVCQISNQSSTGAAATGGTVELVSGGEWVNTTSQINQIDLRTAGGANLNSGSGFAVFGMNLIP